MKTPNIQMVDLMSQYSKIKNQIDVNIVSTIESGRFVNGPIVSEFSENLSKFLNIKYVIPCANGTDAIELILRGLEIGHGDEIILPTNSFIATSIVVHDL